MKQIELRKREELKDYMEKRKSDAFKLLEEAEVFLNQAKYDEALEFYHSAELILNEIHYPTDIIRSSIHKVQEKKREQELLKQREIEIQIQREREEREFQTKISENIETEKERLKVKKLRIEKEEELKGRIKKRREEAFSILDTAQKCIDNKDYDKAIENYRRAELMLNEIHYPTDSIRQAISRAMKIKEEIEKAKELELQRELERLEGERELVSLLEERKRQEKEQKMAHQLALQEREKVIEEQMSYREAAYNLLEEAGKYLKTRLPNYEKAIGLYFQARNLLAEKIGWEPEIENLNNLIRDLQAEKAKYLESQRIEAQTQLKRQQEYEEFQDEMRRKRLDYERQMEDQRLKLKEFEDQKKLEEELKSKGFKLIDEAKRYADFKEFDKAYYLFDKAINHFREIGWSDQIHYIETEIKNTKIFEEKAQREELEVKKMQEEVQEKLKREIHERKKEAAQMKVTVEEVGDLAEEVNNMIRSREDSLRLAEIRREEQIKDEAKQFSSSMGKMLGIKQELLSELKKAKEEEQKKKEDLEKQKEKEKVDEIKRMLRDMKKK
ncbi:MAG: hypothetical protein EU539_05865 [Promethearchaeota archaeon]|nr:MAG: hypothetical protein EU539_05865 [Candidatus Lokiarchaeota archaeon]